MLSHLQTEVGVEVEVQFREGGGGWVSGGWIKQK